MSCIVGTAVAAIAALLGGYIVKFIGRKTAAYVFALINLFAGVFFYLISMHTPSLFELYAGICLLWGAYGLSTVVIYTTSMDAVRPSSAGTDFTVQIVVTHLSSMLIAVFSGKVGDLVGYHSLFGIEALLSVCSVLILFYVYPVKLKYGNR
jgi:predicted MFS family arabinose efflux permease